jgi:hypothetical protein
LNEEMLMLLASKSKSKKVRKIRESMVGNFGRREYIGVPKPVNNES